MGEILERFFTIELAAWTAVMGLFAHFLRARNERLRDSVTEKASDWTRLRDEIKRLDDRIDQLLHRCDHLQNEVDECRKREAEWMSRAIAAEAFQLGEGEALQAAQRILSAEREGTRKKSGNGGAGE